MRNRVFVSFACLLMGGSLALADYPAPPLAVPAYPATDAPMPDGSSPFNAGYEAPCDNSCFWVRGEYLMWWTKSMPVPTPLVTTAAPTASGLLGDSRHHGADRAIEPQ